MAVKYLVVGRAHLRTKTELQFDDCQLARTGTGGATKTDVGPIPLRIDIAEEEDKKRPMVVLEQVGKRSASIPLRGKLDRNGVRLVLRCCEDSFRSKHGLVRLGKFLP